jgi:hypothetical protein
VKQSLVSHGDGEVRELRCHPRGREAPTPPALQRVARAKRGHVAEQKFVCATAAAVKFVNIPFRASLEKAGG